MAFDAKKSFEEEQELDRRLGLTESFSIVIGRIIGSGIFRTPGPMMVAVGAVSLFYGAWVIGGIMTLLGALLYAELVSMMPRSGGPYEYLRTAYGDVWAFLRGWAMFFVSETAAIAAVALVFAEYASGLVGYMFGDRLPRFGELMLALLVIWSMTAINLFGVALSGRVQNIFSTLKVIALAVIVGSAFGVGAGNGSWDNFSDQFWPGEWTWHTMIAMGAAMRYGFFAYSGWEGATYVAGEVKNPRRNLPISIIVGIIGVMLLYIAVNTAYLFQLPVDDVKESGRNIASVAMERSVGPLGGALIALAVMLSTFGNVSTQILVKARTWYAMSRDRLFIKAMDGLHPKYRTPNRALLIQAAWASVLLLTAGFATRTYETIIDFFAATSAIFNMSTFAAVWVLRRRYPDAKRPFRTPFFGIVLPLVLLVQVWFFIVTIIDAPIPSMLGMLLTSTGLIYYYFIKDKDHDEDGESGGSDGPAVPPGSL